MAQTQYGDISQRTAAWAANEMLAHAEPIIVLNKFGQTKPVPKNKADNAKFRRPVPFTVSTTPLAEGVTPTAQQMQYEDVAVALQQYGAVTEITDKVADLSEDPVLKDSSMLSGEQAAETMEMICYGVLKGGTNVVYTNGTSRSAVNTALDASAVQSAVRTLQANRARKITSILDGSTKYNTKPVEAGFVAFAHTDVEADIRALANFTVVAEYGSRQPLCPEELGTFQNVRFVCSPLFDPFLAAGSGTLNGMKSVGAANVDVYPVIVVGKEAFGTVPLKGAGAIHPSVLNPGTVSKSDPLGQRGTVGWKAWYAAVRLNETWMVRIECGVSDLA